MLPTLYKSLPCSTLLSTCRRSVSSKTKFLPPSDKRMEALVSLYHQSDTFITPENLSAVIDQAFTQPLNIEEDHSRHSARELYRLREHIAQSPKFFLGRDDGAGSLRGSESMGPGWTENKSRRVDRVYQALMGTRKDGRPSWLALKENSERVKSQLGKENNRT